MPVVDRYGHFCGVARLVGDNDFLLAVCGSEGKAVVFVKRDLCAVYGDGIYIFLVNRYGLRFAIDFPSLMPVITGLVPSSTMPSEQM